jgi:hypothetical protein
MMYSPTKVTSTMASSSGAASSNSEAKRLERTMHEGWLKMIHKDIQQQKAEDETSSGVMNTRGVISEMILKFKTSLPWLICNAYNYYSRQATLTPKTVITINHALLSQVSGLTSFETDVARERHTPLVFDLGWYW